MWFYFLCHLTSFYDSVIDISPESYDSKSFKSIETDISETLQRFAEDKTLSTSGSMSGAPTECRGMEALREALEQVFIILKLI